MVKSFDDFNKRKITEQEGEEPVNRLFGTGDNNKRDLIKSLIGLIDMISKSSPVDQESYDQIKMRIREAKDSIVNHEDFVEFKEQGFEWQDTRIKMSQWGDDLKKAVASLHHKATKKGLS